LARDKWCRETVALGTPETIIIRYYIHGLIMNLMEKNSQKQALIGIIGLGYLGLPWFYDKGIYGGRNRLVKERTANQ
jgi:hypothetical protein